MSTQIVAHEPAALSTISRTLFVSTPQRKSRLPGLGASVLTHCALIAAMMLWPVNKERRDIVAVHHHTYSVRFVQLQMPREFRRPSSSASAPAPAQLRQTAKLRPASRRSVHRAAASSSVSGAAQSLAREHRPFKLPPNVRVQPVKQTLVQMDLPPDIVLKHDMPLPTALLWTEIAPPPPMRRRFIAPPVRKAMPKIAQSLPAAPTLNRPNREINPAELSIASVIATETPHLVQPPSVASPVARTGQEPAKEIPQIGLANSVQASAANLISLPANPLRSSTLLVLPPANQIAASDAGSAGSRLGHGAETGVNSQQTGSIGLSTSGAAGSGATGSGHAMGANRNEPGTGSVAASGKGSNGTGPGGGGQWSASGSAGILTGGNALAGLIRITLPEDGKFGVVVLGSASSAAYPESIGALSGKVVYTVYLKVGLRKSWILQYCLPKAADKNFGSGRSATAVEAPWPFLMMRPDQWSASDPDYIIVHGTLTAAGKFDQLAMVFPDELEKKELILKSLKLWAFRPASRDGVPVAVEVLLIIPREVE
jgi:hypothetical protein